jgi:sugar (pentulose or hexulose) kinase
MFTGDRDLLVLEPNLLRDIGWVGQRLVSATGSVSGTTVTVTGADLVAAGVSPGMVALYDATPIEITAVVSTTAATVSLIRAEPDGALIPPPAMGSKPVIIATFVPQIALVHSQVLRLLGIDPEGEGEGGGPTEADITNARSLWLVEALGTLYTIYSAAAALAAPDSALAARAEMYRRRFAEERRLGAARIDLDGDGVADATRRLSLVQLMRG